MSNKTVDSSHCGLSEEDMIILLRLLKKCVNSECVTAVDVASHALQVISLPVLYCSMLLNSVFRIS